MAMHISKFISPDQVTIRQLWPAEQSLFRGHFDKLDPAARTLRFGGPVHDSFIDIYVRSAFSAGNMVFGAFICGELVGVSEIKLIASQLPLRAEAAFSVLPDWQDKGVGDALMIRIIAVLQNRGVRNAFLWCSKSNVRMRHLAEKYGAELGFASEDDACCELQLSWPMPSSIIEELFGEASCYAKSFMVIAQPAARTVPAGSLPS
jgi:GNAT superfamily N-acetyltransferase